MMRTHTCRGKSIVLVSSPDLTRKTHSKVIFVDCYSITIEIDFFAETQTFKYIQKNLIDFIRKVWYNKNIAVYIGGENGYFGFYQGSGGF